jgi:acyl carrier protein
VILERVKTEIACLAKLDVEAIQADAWLIEYGLDSVTSVDLIMNLEAELDIEIADEDLANLTTVADIVDLIEAKLAFGAA